MEKNLEWLNENPWLNFVFLTLTLISIILTIYFYQKSHKRKKIVYDIRSLNVISESVTSIYEIYINYKKKKIKNLTVSKIAFWNNGNQTINDSDQAQTDRFKITLNKDYEILKSTIIFQSFVSNNVTILEENNIIEISFDYLDPNQGGIIKMIHTGKKSTDINVLGTFKSVGKIKHNKFGLLDSSLSALLLLPFLRKSSFTSREKKYIIKLFPWLIIIIGVVAASTTILVSNEEFIYPATFVGALYLFIGLKLIFRKTILPNGFEIFYDDE